MKKRSLDEQTANLLEEHAVWLRSRFREGKRAYLVGVDLEGVSLAGRDLSGARLQFANLSHTDLTDTVFHGDNPRGANLSGSQMFDTVFRRVDLRWVRGLVSVKHTGPSTVGVDTVVSSAGQIPTTFLVGSGLSPQAAEAILKWGRRLGRRRAYPSVFISYGGGDEPTAARLSGVLEAAGVDTFFFPASGTIGERLHRVMRVNVTDYDRVLLVCSKRSLDRPGVLNEIEECLVREAREGGSEILIPIRLDDYVFDGWSPDRSDLADAVKARVIGDFRTATTDPFAFRAAVDRLLQALARSSKRLSNKQQALAADGAGG